MKIYQSDEISWKLVTLKLIVNWLFGDLSKIEKVKTKKCRWPMVGKPALLIVEGPRYPPIWKTSFLSTNCCGYFWAALKKLGHFYSNIWSHWMAVRWIVPKTKLYSIAKIPIIVFRKISLGRLVEGSRWLSRWSIRSNWSRRHLAESHCS